MPQRFFQRNLAGTSFYYDHKEWFRDIFTIDLWAHFFRKIHGRALAILGNQFCPAALPSVPQGSRRRGIFSIRKLKSSRCVDGPTCPVCPATPSLRKVTDLQRGSLKSRFWLQIPPNILKLMISNSFILKIYDRK